MCRGLFYRLAPVAFLDASRAHERAGCGAAFVQGFVSLVCVCTQGTRISSYAMFSVFFYRYSVDADVGVTVLNCGYDVAKGLTT